MFGDAALFSDPSLRCEAVACSKGSPGLEATDVQKEFLQLLQPFEEKKHELPVTWGYDFGASLRLWQLRLLCETAVKLTIQAQNHAKAYTGKTLWGHLIKLERLILGILGIIHVRSCGLTFTISHEFFWS